MPRADAKEKLKRDFSKEPDKYYRVRLFDEMGFHRRMCAKCGSYFWTLDPDRVTCPNPPCEQYSFIGKPPMKGMDYIETWRAIERFFVKNGHESIPSYPVVCRWFPGLYFTVASIVAFQRSVAGETVFEMPAEKVIIPQVCLRFSDIENVGVTGRHMTNFIMVGQHSIYEKINGVQKGYWKDTCVQLDYDLLTKALGLKPKDITFMEDVWVGPNAFGYSLEYYVGGLELGNAVFTEFVGTPEKYRPMGYRVIDMGAGLERFTWISQGTHTAYDAVYGPVMKDLKKTADFNEDIFKRYSEISGGLNIDEAGDVRKAKAAVAKKLGITVPEMEKNVEPLQALYAIADHSKTLLYAINDGGLPSNVGGGYNLRIIFRRALGFIEKHNLDLDIYSVCEKHAKYLKPLNPALMQALPEIEEILKVEEERYKNTISKGKGVIMNLLKDKYKNEITNDQLMPLYESQGITPELIERVAEKEKIPVKIPPDFYQQLSGRHMKETAKDEKKKKSIVDVKGLAPTKLLFYEHENEKDFTAIVQKVIKDGKDSWVVLDRTLFYPEGGGQDFDTGTISGKEVERVEKFGGVAVHRVKDAHITEGEEVRCVVNWERRLQHAQHHTAVHIINGAARKMLGNHVWQAGSGKTTEKAHLDITHYEALTLPQVSKLEELANGAVEKKLPIKKEFLPRPQAEKLYGMRIYQGGAIPDRMVRIVSTQGWDVEACAGTHLSNTKDAGKIVIISSERIQDGVVRLTLKAGKAGEAYIKDARTIASNLYEILRGSGLVEFSGKPHLAPEFSMLSDLRKGAETFSVGLELLEATAKKFTREIEGFSKKDFCNVTALKPIASKDMSSALSYVFDVWKAARKEAEKSGSGQAEEKSADLLKKAKNGLIVEVMEGERNDLIKAASAALEKDEKMTIILSNPAGELVVMSSTRDTGAIVSKVCAACGGKGGGKGNLAQGRIESTTKLKTVKL
jgi:alanyl-tRNA synthetase